MTTRGNLLAVGCSLRYLTGGGAGWIAIGCAAAAVSIWTIDVAFPALPFVPLLLFWRGGTEAWVRWRDWRRKRAGAARKAAQARAG